MKATPKPPAAVDPATKDLSVIGAAGKLKGRRRQIDDAIDEAS